MTLEERCPLELLSFLQQLDSYLASDRHLELYLGGGAAILLAYEGQLATDDVDVIGPKEGILLELVGIAGKGSEIHGLTGYFLDVVPPGLFPSAQGWANRALAIDLHQLRNIKLRVLEIHDLIISKLGPKRFGSKDRADVQSLCDRPELNVKTLRERYWEARQRYDYDEREKMDRSFQIVEVQFLGLEPTQFE